MQILGNAGDIVAVNRHFNDLCEGVRTCQKKDWLPSTNRTNEESTIRRSE